MRSFDEYFVTENVCVTTFVRLVEAVVLAVENPFHEDAAVVAEAGEHRPTTRMLHCAIHTKKNTGRL